MFRFSIRELMLVTLVVAMGIAWLAEHRRAVAASDRIHRFAERRQHEYRGLNKDLAGWGLDLVWVTYRGAKVDTISHWPGDEKWPTVLRSEFQPLPVEAGSFGLGVQRP